MRLKWPDFNEKGTVIIELAPESFCLAKNNIELLDEIFTPKEEIHITLIGSELGLIIQDKIQHNKTIKKILEKTFEEIDWSFNQTGPVHILSRSNKGVTEKSIVMLVEMPGVTEFYVQLKTLGLIDAETPVPPPHVTMYTQNCPPGIGVSSNKALNTLSIKTFAVKVLNKLC